MENLLQVPNARSLGRRKRQERKGTASGRPSGTLLRVRPDSMVGRYGRRDSMNHFTNRAGFNAISSQTDWCFKASQPPADHPKGAYFTTLTPQTPNLAVRLRIPREKLGFLFEFSDAGDLLPLDGGRGSYIFYSPTDYLVAEERQKYKGSTNL